MSSFVRRCLVGPERVGQRVRSAYRRLDADRQAGFLKLLLQECSDAGATLLFVSHDRRLASAFTREIELPAVNSARAEGQAA